MSCRPVCGTLIRIHSKKTRSQEEADSRNPKRTGVRTALKPTRFPETLFK